MTGRLITFEGPEGAGKSTQIALLARALGDRNVDVVVTREPGGTALGEQLRALLLRRDGPPVAPATEALLHTAARAQHVAEVIRPGILAGKTVLCDRFVDSTLAYQGGGRGLPLDDLRSIQRLATGGIVPDASILLDLPADEGLQRRRLDSERWNRMDDETLAFHRRVRETYRRLAGDEPDRWIVVEASGSIADIARAIETTVAARFGLPDVAVALGARA